MRHLWATWCGRRDGLLLIPQGSDPAPWIQKCWAGARAQAERIQTARTRAETRLAARREMLRLAGAQASDVLHKLEAAEAYCAEQREALLAQAEHLRRETGSPMGNGLPTWGYAVLVVGLCGLELPLLQMAFTTFGLPPLYTLLLSTLCAALTGFLGHTVGTLSRHLRVSARPVLVFILLGSLAFVGSLAYLRESAMAALSSDTLVLNPVAAAWALFAISVMTLAAAALLAWHHRVAPLAAELARASRALNRAHRRTGRARRRLLRLAGQELQAAQRLKAADALAEHRTQESFLRYQQLIHVYISANVRAREDNRLPEGLREANLPWNQKEEYGHAEVAATVESGAERPAGRPECDPFDR